MSSLPILDLRSATDPATAAEFHTKLREATRDYGFFYLIGHGIPKDLSEELIATSRKFFALPEEDKIAIEKVNSPHFRGYTRVGDERTQGAKDWREQIDIGPEREPTEFTSGQPWSILDGPNLWPSALPEFRDTIERWRKSVEAVARTLLSSWLLALGQAPDALDDAFNPPNTLLKVVRYPEPPDEEKSQGVGAHKDGGVLTLLFVEPGKGGLQVEKDGEWIGAQPVDDALIINICEMLEVATNGYLKATNHRVISVPGEGERISVPYFFNPKLDSTFPKWELPEALATEAPGITADPSNPIHDTYGLNVLKSRFRSHPDVTERYHSELAAELNS